MSSDNQFTALGPAIIGFQTNASRIERGAEIAGNEAGVHGIGPTGILGTGVRNERHGGTDAGRGGRFASIPGRAQVNLQPQRMNINGVAKLAEPFRLTNPVLPRRGEPGDLWMSVIPDERHTPAALFLCIVGDREDDHHQARWSQVLLGDAIEGTSDPHE